MIDFSMDQLVGLIVVAVLLAHIGVLLWSGWLRKGIAPVVGLNLLTSGSAVAYWGLNFTDLAGSIEPVWVFAAFELAVFATSLLAVFRVRVPHAAIWILFAVHALMTGLALLFILTFRITRLI